ncbi:MAG TPA: hypothetical protein VFH63_09015 [candidate division Zixibacteria bacterium]|nr:hypothetical protein [candidate division Zixibacteria bacterium]
MALLVTMVISACGTSETGPLALVDATGDMARNEGTVVITDACIFLERGGERGLLVWPADRTRWNEGDRTISFSTLDGAEVTVESGQQVVLAGGGAGAGEDGEDWTETIQWARRPAPECAADGAWFVTDVE